MDNEHGDRPHRRSALVARELRRFDIDIAALSETRCAGDGQLREHGAGYTFFWKGKGEEEKRIHGVGFAIKNEIVDRMTELPVGVSERLMTLRMRLVENRWVTIISAYAPTLDADDATKEDFYAQLVMELSKIPREDKIILLGDFNARVGHDADLWDGIIGKEGVGSSNSNGILLLTKCAEFGLVITNTLFRQKNKFKTSWQHPRSKHWHLIDYVIVRAQDRKDVFLTRAMIGADDCWTDHRLIRSIMQINIAPKRWRKCKQMRPKINVEGLRDPEKLAKLQEELSERLSCEYPEAIEQHWNMFKTAVHSACEASIGFKKRWHQDWFDENDVEIQELIDQKHEAFSIWQSDGTSMLKRRRFQEARAAVQYRTRDLKNDWWVKKSQEIQQFADSNNSREFFMATKAVYGPSIHGVNPLRSRDGTVLFRDKESIDNRWREHFQELLNCHSTVDSNIYKSIPQKPMIDSLGFVPTLLEVEVAVQRMKKNKAGGPDGIPADVFKEGGDAIIKQLHNMVVKIWDSEEIPSDLRDAYIVTIFKKGDKAECGNYRGISLLSSAGKIIAHVLLNRLLSLSEECLPETQCGFRSSRGTVDMIFSARQIQEKCREQGRPLYMAFIDLTKAFDSVDRDALWKILILIGCPPKYIAILRLLHDNMTASVIGTGGLGMSFGITTGVKQGCIIAPTLFSLYVAGIMHLVEGKLPTGVDIVYRVDGSVFNLNRFKSKTKISVTSVVDLQYADDNVLLAQSEEELQLLIDVFCEAYIRLGLKVNIKKTQILYQPSPNSPGLDPVITVNGEALQSVDYFPYLGSCLSTKANIDVEIQHRLKCASVAYGRLNKRVFDNRDIREETKVMVYRAVVVPTLLYGCEAWTTYRRHLHSLERYNQWCLRKIFQIRWQDKHTNVDVLARADMTSIESQIIKKQLRWTGHVVRMHESRLPKRIFYSQLKSGHRSRGGQFKRYRDALKANLKKCHIDVIGWESATQDRMRWREVVNEGVQCFEKDRITDQCEKRMRRKEGKEKRQCNFGTMGDPSSFECQHCGKICRSRIGLFSHLKVH